MPSSNGSDVITFIKLDNKMYTFQYGQQVVIFVLTKITLPYLKNTSSSTKFQDATMTGDNIHATAKIINDKTANAECEKDTNDTNF
jgi:hypothetical protein